jgi:hypothetical protein
VIIVNFSDIAPVPPATVYAEELREILRGCNEMLIDYTEDELTQCLNDWETALCYMTLAHEAQTPDWYTRALVCICLRGLRGEVMPKFSVINE